MARSRTFILTVGSTVDVIAYAFMEIRPAEAGSCQLGTRIAELHTLSVLPEQRGAHIGSELLSAVRRELADRGVKHMLIGVIATNSDAFRFYERHEFRPFMTTLIGHV